MTSLKITDFNPIIKSFGKFVTYLIRSSLAYLTINFCKQQHTKYLKVFPRFIFFFA